MSDRPGEDRLTKSFKGGEGRGGRSGERMVFSNQALGDITEGRYKESRDVDRFSKHTLLQSLTKWSRAADLHEVLIKTNAGERSQEKSGTGRLRTNGVAW